MNDDDFEKKLLALTGASGRLDPTPAWKADILARALREAEAAPFTRLAPPRWLLLSWAAAWIAILALNITTPRDPTTGAPRRVAAAPVIDQPPEAKDVDPSTQTLFAFQRMNPNLDLPW